MPPGAPILIGLQPGFAPPAALEQGPVQLSIRPSVPQVTVACTSPALASYWPFFHVKPIGCSGTQTGGPSAEKTPPKEVGRHLFPQQRGKQGTSGEPQVHAEEEDDMGKPIALFGSSEFGIRI